MTHPRARPLLPAGSVAVLLNANAGRVRRRHAGLVRALLPDALLLWTRSLDEAHDAVEAIAASRIDTVFAGGGDGTIIDVANRLLRYTHVPRLGILRLGTGNALSTWVGARAVAEDLAAWASGEPIVERPMHLLEADGERFPFAGLGLDAAALNDYKAVKERMEATALRGLSQQLWVWLASIFGRTVPRLALERSAVRVRVVVRGGDGVRVDRDGAPIGPVVPPGGVLYEGPANLVAFATTPYYGYALHMFPHATRRSGAFQLRISAMDVATVVNEIHRLWTGELTHERLHDYLVSDVEIAFERPVPYQVGGDARGFRERLRVRVAEHAIPVVAWATRGAPAAT